MAAKSTGLNKNTKGALAYVFGYISGALFLIFDKDKFVRFHAVQSIVVFVGFLLLQWVMRFLYLPIIFYNLVSLVKFILWILLIYKAWQGEEWEVPYLGKVARNLAKKA